MANPWTCPRCNATWTAPENQGRCHNCGYGLETVELHAPPLYPPNGQVLSQVTERPAPVYAPQQAPQPSQETVRLKAVLEGISQMLQPAVTWLQSRGIGPVPMSEIIPTLLRILGSLESQAKQHEQAMKEQARTVDYESFIKLEQSVQQLALAVASLNNVTHAVSTTPVPQAPAQPYSTFILTDENAAQLERQILQQQTTEGFATWMPR